MNILVVGSGGREHAICHSIRKSSHKIDRLYCAPGNAGIGEIAECVDIGAMEFDKLCDFWYISYEPFAGDICFCFRIIVLRGILQHEQSVGQHRPSRRRESAFSNHGIYGF